jgi:hypothetical protein
MPGVKRFINQTNVNLSVTLYVRSGADPSGGDAGQQQFALPGNGGESCQQYGDDANIFLNGLSFVADEGGTVSEGGEFVVLRGVAYDNLLNMNDTITFTDPPSIDNVQGANQGPCQP